MSDEVLTPILQSGVGRGQLVGFQLFAKFSSVGAFLVVGLFDAFEDLRFGFVGTCPYVFLREVVLVEEFRDGGAIFVSRCFLLAFDVAHEATRFASDLLKISVDVVAFGVFRLPNLIKIAGRAGDRGQSEQAAKQDCQTFHRGRAPKVATVDRSRGMKAKW